MTYNPQSSTNENLEAFGLRKEWRETSGYRRASIYRGAVLIDSMDCYECVDFLRAKDGLSPIFDNGAA